MRSALISCLLCWLALNFTPARAESVRVLVQDSPLAGFQYHAGAEFWNELHVGDVLTLVREPENAYDPNAVRVEWKGRKLGYLPRRENAAVAAEMDRGTRVEGRIGSLVVDRNPWRRVRIEVFVAL
ncbi:MAG: HIRAN protein [Rhodocyclaceae bacterium]|nr:HIRAN protein [Rhodocyclaceae bacterium]